MDETAARSETRLAALRGWRSWDAGAAFLLGLVVAVNVPFLAARLGPFHDTFYNFVNFEVFYSHFFLEHDLVRWYPYGAYGHPAGLFQAISLSPLSYAFGLGGALLRVQNPLLLFHLSSVAEHAVFVLSVYALARRLFARRTTALVLGIAACGTVVWHIQQWFEIRFFYLLPLVLYFAVGFLARPSPARFWLAGLGCVAWGLGNVPYFAPIWALVLLAVLAPSALAFPWKTARLPRPGALDAALILLLCVGAFGYSVTFLSSFDALAMLEDGRDLHSGVV